ncbi:DUF2057 domain-containing protein [Shewanella algae]|jgi:uncharacterized protein YccT (UPF0319 family)|uniref:DUF2057 domain-containing protein n=1 Tax=Shewanella chilikensis TaxID=558541 RepID=A0A6G7LXR3_9GAMM|nr:MULTISPECIES: DUF2057 family protein [Shewanella]AXQ14085.1 hypothetical protein BS332_06975 [Shewanella algae]MCA0950909.1 DUF2057 domain-containing protein [Shewanella chilikensis]MCL1153646.1 DUF2057 domain-containing protein [Shewanella chilikensis]PYE59574.1 uncharacterized protein DUF2057 [Shewanella chilikensis]QHD53237.1 DUF2057 domain-containing protein [Shewanella algae]
MSAYKISASRFSAALLMFASLFMASGSFAAELNLPDNLVIKAIDGQAVSNFDRHQLSAGKHIVELKYRDIFAVNADDSGSWVKSGPLYLTLTVAEQQSLQLQLPTLDTEAEANAFIRSPELKVVDEAGQAVPAEIMTHGDLMADWLAQLRR